MYIVGRGHIICRVSKDRERICRDLADGRSSIVGEREYRVSRESVGRERE